MALSVRRTPTPTLNRYQDGKPLLRQDFHLKCAYCALHEGEFGGWRNFHVEHFRPKSRFPNRREDYMNLLYSCSVCNLLKGASWFEGNPIQLPRAYLDPCEHDYAQYFQLHADGRIAGTIPAARFMVEKLDLNRSHLVDLRRLRGALQGIIDRARDGKLRAMHPPPTEPELATLALALGIVEDLARLHLSRMTSEPYPHP